MNNSDKLNKTKKEIKEIFKNSIFVDFVDQLSAEHYSFDTFYPVVREYFKEI